MKKRIVQVLAMMLCCALIVSALSGCIFIPNIIPKKPDNVSSEPISELPPESSEAPETSSEPELPPVEPSIPEEISEPESIIPPESSQGNVVLEKTEPRELTDKELDKIEIMLSPSGYNNGFLASLYSKPSKIDLHQALYSGVGIDVDYTDKDKQILCDKYGWDAGAFEYTHIFKLPASKVKSFVKKRTGRSLSSYGDIEGFTYCSEADAYFTAHGDTNAIMIDVEKGSVDGDGVYTIYYENENGYVIKNGEGIFLDDDDCVVKFTMPDGKTPQFISNLQK